MTKMEKVKALTEFDLLAAADKYYSTKEFMKANNLPVSHARYSKIVNDKMQEFSINWKLKKSYDTIKCLICENLFKTQVNIKQQKKTCSDICAKELTARSNRKVSRDLNGFANYCWFCGEGINSEKFCNNHSCQKLFNREVYINSWKAGEVSGNYNSKTLGLSKHIRGYLLDKYNNSCVKCGWAELHPDDGLPLVEINHINGDASNSTEDNLEVLCPNCHSKTSNFRARNKNSARDRN